MKLSVTYDGKTVEFRGDPNAADPVEDFLKYAQVSVVEESEPTFPTWTFYGHWENDRIVIESHEEGEHEDDREDTGYWEQGLWAASGEGPTVELAEVSALLEYEDEPSASAEGYSVGRYDTDPPAHLDELTASELADFAAGMVLGAWRGDPASFGTWRQTACVLCGSDVEGQIGSTEWRDRGGNTGCHKSERYDASVGGKVWYTPPATQKHIGRLP